MLQPVGLALVLALFWGAAPRAEAAPSRTKRERPVSVTGTPAEPLPEIRVEKATPTLLLFPAPILKSTLTVDESRIQVLDAGERSIIVHAVEELLPGERHELAVFFADGRAPARAAFLLVTDPAEMDARVDVERSEAPNAPCPAEASRPPPRLEDFVLLGYLDKKGVQTDTTGEGSDAGQGLKSSKGVAYRGADWMLMDVRVTNLTGQQPWTPREAALTGRQGVTIPARLVTAESGELAPGDERRVLAVVDSLPKTAGGGFSLQLRGSGGRTLTIPGVALQGPSTGGNP